LKSAIATEASDEHLKVGQPPFIKKNGYIKRINMPALTKEDLDRAVMSIAPTTLLDDIALRCDVDFMYEIKGCSRFRVNYNRQMGNPALVIRNIPYEIPVLSKLNLPNVLNDIIKHQNGIILVTGPTGSGKSTTIASLINQICLNDEASTKELDKIMKEINAALEFILPEKSMFEK
jgi:twitching motility protein PilT